MKIASLIVTYNRLEKLKYCLEITQKQDFSHIIIVDNCSTDGTSDWLDQLNDHRLTILRPNENLGGAGGFHYGVEYMASHVICDWIVLYDDDAYPDFDTIKKFKNIVNPDCKIYYSRVVNDKGELIRMNQPYSSLPQNLISVIKNKIINKNNRDKKNQCKEIHSFSFVGVFINSQLLFTKYKLIRKELFIYFDDVFFSWSLVKDGYRIKYEPGLTFIHDSPEATRVVQPEWKVYYLIRNLILSFKIFEKNERPFSVTIIILKILRYLSLTIYQKSKMNYVKFILSGIFDGIKNKNGRRH